METRRRILGSPGGLSLVYQKILRLGGGGCSKRRADLIANEGGKSKRYSHSTRLDFQR